MMARYFFVDYAISSISGVLFNCNLANFSIGNYSTLQVLM